MMNSHTITCSINRQPSDVYKFASNPANLSKWIRSFCLSVKQSEGAWQMETAIGWLEIEFVRANEFGVLDHVVKLPNGQSIRISMRVVPNGDGSEVMFTLLQLPEMTDEQFAKDTLMVETDLLTLKEVLEGCESVD